MLWQRGGGRYRPIVPVNLALEDLEVLDFDEWEDLELPETNFDWSVPVDESPDTRDRRLADNAREVWVVDTQRRPANCFDSSKQSVTSVLNRTRLGGRVIAAFA